jgi:hypothetical protein
MLASLSFRSLVQLTGLAIGLLFVLGYVVFQARFLIVGPQITLTDTPAGLSNERQIFLTGVAANISRIWLNDRPIFTDPNGNFKEALVLENGYTMATLRAEDRYGRTTTITQPFVYVPACFPASKASNTVTI